MALVPYGGGGSPNRDMFLQLALMTQMGQLGGQVAQGLKGHQEKQALASLLSGRKASLSPALAGLDIRKDVAGPGYQTSIPGLMETGKLTPQMGQAFLLKGGNPEALVGLLPKPGEGFTLKPGSVRYDASGNPIASAPALPGTAKPPAMRDRLEGTERVFEQYNPATGQWDRLSTGPAFAPPSQTNVNVKIPAEYPAAPQGMHYEGDFASGNVQLVPTEGFQPEISGDAARVSALAPGALQDLQSITRGIIGEGGAINREAVAQMNLPVVGDVPGTTGSGLRSQMEGALDLMTVMRTGASATAEQMAAYRRAYMPSPLDSDATIRDKLTRFQRDIGSALAISQRGRGDVPEPAAPPVQPAEPTWMDQLLQQGAGMVQGAMPQGAPPAAMPMQPQAGGPAMSGSPPQALPQAPQAGAGGLPVVQDQAAYDALPPGAKYTSGDGVTRTKGAR